MTGRLSGVSVPIRATQLALLVFLVALGMRAWGEEAPAEKWTPPPMPEATPFAEVNLSDEQVHSLRQAGFDVHPWTVNDEADMRRLMRAGVTGIITDFPQRLRQLLAAYESGALSA